MQFTIHNAIFQLTTSLKKTGTVRRENQFKLILEEIGKLSARGKQFEDRQVFAVKSLSFKKATLRFLQFLDN